MDRQQSSQSPLRPRGGTGQVQVTPPGLGWPDLSPDAPQACLEGDFKTIR